MPVDPDVYITYAASRAAGVPKSTDRGSAGTALRSTSSRFTTSDRPPAGTCARASSSTTASTGLASSNIATSRRRGTVTSMGM